MVTLEEFKKELEIEDDELAKQLFNLRVKGDEIKFPDLQTTVKLGDLAHVKTSNNLEVSAYVLSSQKRFTKKGQEMQLVNLCDLDASVATAFLFQQHADADLSTGDFVTIKGARLWMQSTSPSLSLGPEATIKKIRHPKELEDVMLDGKQEFLEDKKAYKFEGIWGLSEIKRTYNGCPICYRSITDVCTRCGQQESKKMSFRSVYATDGKVQFVFSVPPTVKVEVPLKGAKFNAYGHYKTAKSIVEVFKMDVEVPGVDHDAETLQEVESIIDIHRVIDFEALVKSVSAPAEKVRTILDQLEANKKIDRSEGKIRRI